MLGQQGAALAAYLDGYDETAAFPYYALNVFPRPAHPQAFVHRDLESLPLVAVGHTAIYQRLLSR